MTLKWENDPKMGKYDQISSKGHIGSRYQHQHQPWSQHTGLGLDLNYMQNGNSTYM